MKSNPKKEIVTSAIAGVCALALAGTSVGLYYASQPVAPDQYAKVHTVFYEGFNSADQIATMQLTAVDSDGEAQTFQLEKQNGLWIIPTHHNYPAEAGQRLSQTATALQGLERLRLANAAKGAQDNLGVLDPTSDAAKENPDAAGKLIQFKDSNDEVLFELIVGNQVEKKENANVYDLQATQDEGSFYYVRVPSENETYVAELSLDISNKFSDWINQDLLELTTGQLRKLKLDNYRLESRNVIANGGISVQRQLVREGELVLSKSSASDPWTVPDMAPNQEVDSAKVDQVLEAIENVELVGVRPQYTYQGQSLLDDELQLSLPEALQKDQQAAIQALEEMQSELINAGFGLAQDPQTGKTRLVAEFGEMEATSNEGIIYTLFYGAEVQGEGSAIEIGSTGNNETAKDNNEAEKTDGGASAADASAEDAEAGRLVMIRVTFDPEQVEGKPVEPVQPEKMTLPENFGIESTPTPTFDAPPVPRQEDGDTNSEVGSEPTGETSTEEPNPNASPEETPESSEEAAGLFNIQETETGSQDQQAEENAAPAAPAMSMRQQAQQQLDMQYQMQMQQYESQKKQYQTQLQQYEEKIEKAKQKAQRLKERFADWYYVVPNSDLEALRMKPADVIKAKPPINQAGQIENPLGLPPGFDPSMLQGR